MKDMPIAKARGFHALGDQPVGETPGQLGIVTHVMADRP